MLYGFRFLSLIILIKIRIF